MLFNYCCVSSSHAKPYVIYFNKLIRSKYCVKNTITSSSLFNYCCISTKPRVIDQSSCSSDSIASTITSSSINNTNTSSYSIASNITISIVSYYNLFSIVVMSMMMMIGSIINDNLLSGSEYYKIIDYITSISLLYDCCASPESSPLDNNFLFSTEY